MQQDEDFEASATDRNELLTAQSLTAIWSIQSSSRKPIITMTFYMVDRVLQRYVLPWIEKEK